MMELVLQDESFAYHRGITSGCGPSNSLEYGLDWSSPDLQDWHRLTSPTSRRLLIAVLQLLPADRNALSCVEMVSMNLH